MVFLSTGCLIRLIGELQPSSDESLTRAEVLG